MWKVVSQNFLKMFQSTAWSAATNFELRVPQRGSCDLATSVVMVTWHCGAPMLISSVAGGSAQRVATTSARREARGLMWQENLWLGPAYNLVSSFHFVWKRSPRKLVDSMQRKEDIRSEWGFSIFLRDIVAVHWRGGRAQARWPWFDGGDGFCIWNEELLDVANNLDCVLALSSEKL